MKKVLAVGAHPDDVEIGCGGSLALLRQQGSEITILTITSGEEGSLSLSKQALASKRENEAQSSAKILGAKQVQFLRQADGLTGFSKEVKIRCISTLREIRPDILFIHASNDLFPDHKTVHDLIRAAVIAAAGPWYSEAKGAPHRISEVYGYEVWHPISAPQLYVDISKVLHLKMECVSAHQTQTGEVGYLEAVRGLAAYRGAVSMRGGFAEAFEVIQTSDFS